jgi:hypothetical protein
MLSDEQGYEFKVCWSSEDDDWAATVKEFPSLSWVASDPVVALRGLVELLDNMEDEMADEMADEES